MITDQPSSVNTNGREPLRLLTFSASRRKDPLNAQLAELAAGVIEKHGGTVDLAGMREFDVPSFDQDVDIGAGAPAGTLHFRDRILANDAFIITSPDHNGSMPGLIKNAIDRVSRFRPQPFNAKHVLLMSASPSMAGGNKALWQLRIPLAHLGARVFPNMFSLAMAHKAVQAPEHKPYLPELLSIEERYAYLAEMETMDEDAGIDHDPYVGYAPPPPQPHVRTTPRIGRNDPCPCGSGKKYKKCCEGK